MKPILLIEDTATLQMVYETVLTNAGHRVVSAGSGAEGMALFKQYEPEIILLDLMLPDRDGLEVMKDCLAQRPSAHVVVITANGSIKRAVEAMRAGAYDFLVKPFDDQRLLNAVRNARLALQSRAVEPDRVSVPLPRFSGFVGSSASMQEVYSKVQSVAQSMATIFISGESGTGKEVCAQAVHDTSPRARGPFVPLNCAAIPPDLLESEVFGHLKGAFTGAIADKQGAAAAADRGTLFLDEICEMDMALQSKLLRFLQTSTIQPLGATKPRKVSVRIICATNRDPMEEVRHGRFREDLFYRLHVIPIVLPPLRDRGRDAIEIAEHALARISVEEGRQFTSLSPEVERRFLQSPWPGNVRQLLNVIRNVVVLHSGPVVRPEMLPRDIEAFPAANDVPDARETTGPGPAPSSDAVVFEGRTLAEIERLAIEAALSRNGGSVPRAARDLDVSPSTIYRKREAWSAAAAAPPRKRQA